MTMARTTTTSSASRAALFLAFYYAMTTMTASSVLGFSSFNLHVDTPRWQPQHSFSNSNRHDNDRKRASTSDCRTITFTRRRPPHRRQKRTMMPIASIFSSTLLQNNLYDDWSSDLLSTSQSEYTYDDLLLLPTNDDDGDIEESVVLCLKELMDSEYGKTMFGRHDVPASVG
jgi:hypothetical protein